MGKVSPASTFAQPPMLPGAHPVMWLCLLHLAMQRHPHKVIFWENEQFPSHMMLKHQRLVNQAPTATLHLTINVNFFFSYFIPCFLCHQNTLQLSPLHTSVLPLPRSFIVMPLVDQDHGDYFNFQKQKRQRKRNAPGKILAHEVL